MAQHVWMHRELKLGSDRAVAVLVAGITSGRQFDPRTTTRCFNLYASDVGQMVLLPKLLGYLRKAAPGASARVWPVPLEKPGLPLSSGDVDVAGGLLRQPHNRVPTILSVPRPLCLRRAGDTSQVREGNDGRGVWSTPNMPWLIQRAWPTPISTSCWQGIRSSARSTLSVPGFHVLPMLIPNSDLVAIVPGMLRGSLCVSTCPSRCSRCRSQSLPSICVSYWHERYHHDASNRWLRNAFVELFRRRGTARSRSVGAART